MATMKERLERAIDKVIPLRLTNTEGIERMKKFQEEQEKTAKEIKQEQGK